MSDPLTVRDLRRRWKPHKERLDESSTNIRFHRACSWLQRVEDNPDDHDLALLTQWTAFNALYGQWDDLQKEPVADQACWRVFLDRMLELDADGQIAKTLVEHKRLVLAIFEDAYLTRSFWYSPDVNRGINHRLRQEALTWYVQKNWTMILDRVVERIYMLRCQLVHGAATHGSRLNRPALRHCTTMMQLLMTSMLCVWIDNGSNEDWGIMCYPPLDSVNSVSLKPVIFHPAK